MKLLWSLLGDAGKASSRVRGFWIADELAARGVHNILRWDKSRPAMMRLALDLYGVDAVIFQKTYSRYHRLVQRLADRLGKATFIDIDDFPSRVSHPTTMANFEAMMARADGIFAGSRALAELAAGHRPRVHLVPSTVRLQNYAPVPPRSAGTPLCLGWIGNGAHYASDLIEILHGPLSALGAARPVRLKIVGACEVGELHAAFGAIPGVETTFVDTLDWSSPSAVMAAIEEFDIGLYPLRENKFNRYKCAFKALEYMASSIPVVASRIAANAEIVEHGVDGLLVEDEGEWIAALSGLIEAPERASAMGRQGRAKVAERYSTEVAADQVATLVEAALAARGRPRPDRAPHRAPNHAANHAPNHGPDRRPDQPAIDA